MTEIDLSTLSLDQLKTLQKDVDKAVRTFESRKKKQALAAAKAAAKDAGFSLDELMREVPGTKSAKTTVPPKYRHPENPEVTWSGRGRQPGWFKEAIEAGTAEKELLIL